MSPLRPLPPNTEEVIVQKHIDKDKSSFNLNNPSLNVLNNVSSGFQLERLLAILGVVSEDSKLEDVIPQAMHDKIALNIETVLNFAKSLSNMMDAKLT